MRGLARFGMIPANTWSSFLWKKFQSETAPGWLPGAVSHFSLPRPPESPAQGGAFQALGGATARRPRAGQPGGAFPGGVQDGRHGSFSFPAGRNHGPGYNSFYAAWPGIGRTRIFFQPAGDITYRNKLLKNIMHEQSAAWHDPC